MKVAYLTLSMGFGGPRLFLDFARTIMQFDVEHACVNLIEEKGKPEQLVNQARGPQVYRWPIREVMSSTSVLMSLLRSFRATVADGVAYRSFRPANAFAIAMSRVERPRYSIPTRSLICLCDKLGSEHDIIHVGGAMMPYTWATLASRKGPKGMPRASPKLVCHAFMHPNPYFSAYGHNTMTGCLDSMWRDLAWRLFSRLLKKFDAVSVSTPYELNNLRRFGCRNVWFVGEGIDLTYIEQTQNQWRDLVYTFRNKWGSGPFILYVGGRHYLKGYEHTVLAFDKLIQEGFRGKLITIGARRMLPQARVSSYVRRAHSTEQGLIKNGKMLDYGYAGELEKYAALAACDIVVLPSVVETVPLVFLEAWAFKKPVIGADIPTVRSVITSPGDGGYLVAYGDVRNLAETIKTVSLDAPLARLTGEKGHRKLATYNLRSVGQRLFEIYHELQS